MDASSLLRWSTDSQIMCLLYLKDVYLDLVWVCEDVECFHREIQVSLKKLFLSIHYMLLTWFGNFFPNNIYLLWFKDVALMFTWGKNPTSLSYNHLIWLLFSIGNMYGGHCWSMVMCMNRNLELLPYCLYYTVTFYLKVLHSGFHLH